MENALRRCVVAVLACLVSSGAVANDCCARLGIPRGPLCAYLCTRDANQDANQVQQLQLLQQLQMIQQSRQRQQDMEAQRQQILQQQQDENRRQELQRLSQIEAIQSTARRSIAESAKGACVEMFLNDAPGREALSGRGATVGQFCGCIEQEMSALLTLDLAGKILVTSYEFAGDGQKFASSPTGKEYVNRYGLALKGCSEQLRRNR